MAAIPARREIAGVTRSMSGMRPRILLFNIPKLLRDLLLGLLREHADVTEMTAPRTDAAATQLPATPYDLVIVCDDPRRDDGVCCGRSSPRKHDRAISPCTVLGEQAAGYTFAPQVELIEALTSERLLSEVVALGGATRPREGSV
jgi:hypothetical protein